MLKLFSKLDKNKAPLPLFITASIAKVPGNWPTKCDVSVFASNLFDLKTNVEAMQCELAALKKNNDCVMGVKAIKDSSNINKSLMVIV